MHFVAEHYTLYTIHYTRHELVCEEISTSIFYVTLFRIYLHYVPLNVDRYSVVVIATRGWTVRESNPGAWRDFPHPSRSALGTTHLPTQLVPVVKRAGSGAYNTPLSSAEVKERVELRKRTIKFTNSPLCACRGSTRQKPWYGLMTLTYQISQLCC